MSPGLPEKVGDAWPSIDAVRKGWPLRLFEGGLDHWWLTGSAALAVHFGGLWRPLGDLDVTINRTVVVAAAVSQSSDPEEPWTMDFRAWFAGPSALPSNCTFLVPDSYGLPASFRCAELLRGYWSSTFQPELVVEASEAILRSESGVPYLAPEWVLLGKSRQRRPKDRDDFDRAVPLLQPVIQTKLFGLLPAGHPWRANPYLTGEKAQSALQ